MKRTESKLLKVLATLVAFSFVTPCFSSVTPASFDREPLNQWMEKQFAISQQKLFANISPSDAKAGSVVASPSRQDPNYYYHWVRDAALVMKTVLRHVYEAKDPVLKQKLLRYLYDHVELTKYHQSRPAAGGLGEVKFFVNGEPFQGPWGRPQNDGPALRATVFTHFAHYLIRNGQLDYVKNNLYNTQKNSNTVIKRDLDYLVNHWRHHDFDLWEEVKGHHFFTRIAQYKAFLDGADLARQLKDYASAAKYVQAANELKKEIYWHWDSRKGFLQSTINYRGGINYKSGLDTSVILGLIYCNDLARCVYALDNPATQSTVERLTTSFSNIYQINSTYRNLGTAYGRYPEDTYDGYTPGRLGNPWFLTTMGVASYYYKLADTFVKKGRIKISKKNQRFFTQLMTDSGFFMQMVAGAKFGKSDPQFLEVVKTLVIKADNLMNRIQFHKATDGSMSEQYNRDNGFMQGARDLTWSHSSLLNAYWDRKAAKKSLKNL